MVFRVSRYLGMFLARREGFEPPAAGFEDQSSSTELTTDGTTARNQTWFSAFAGLCDIHFTTVMNRGTHRCRAGIENGLGGRNQTSATCSQSTHDIISPHREIWSG